MTTVQSVYKTPRPCPSCGREYVPVRAKHGLPSGYCSLRCGQVYRGWRMRAAAMEAKP